ncbi:hypothetical protein FHN55_08365 [Streptomyces sp. NP160]|uniref:type II secretion system F family protein n=1 Tax=Streptomyces sp. NP160 TaxID=2586637 RepID=UPI00111AAF13|nr:type II secretion system F family protein [Streptomyces sp. NP160]TNM68031.1 hypothetical protein FHN55_08365 [Streptomyces sp. NP160]
MTGLLAPDASCAWAAGVMVGLAVLVLPGRPRAWSSGRAGPRRTSGHGAAAEVDPPLVLDLVAAVVSAGAPPAAAVRSVAGVLREAGGPGAAAVAAALEAVAGGAPARGGPSARGPGGPPDTRTGAALAEAVTALQRCLWIAEQTGAPVAALLGSAAAELRRRRRRAAALAAARLGVRVVAPLGLCTLPAFGLLAVVPVLLSLGRGLLG